MVKTKAKAKDDPRDEPVEIDFKMVQKDGKWKVQDIVTEGVSLVSSYRSQFTKIIKKDGFPALIQKMKDKLAKGDTRLTMGGSPHADELAHDVRRHVAVEQRRHEVRAEAVEPRTGQREPLERLLEHPDRGRTSPRLASAARGPRAPPTDPRVPESGPSAPQSGRRVPGRGPSVPEPGPRGPG